MPGAAASASPVIEAAGISKRYGKHASAPRVLDAVDLRVNSGEIVLVFGPSGCGKSTLLSILGGLDRDYAGTLKLFGKSAEALGDGELSALRGRRIGFVFQAFHLLQHLNVLDNVTAPSLFGGDLNADGAAHRRGLEVLEAVGLKERAQAFPEELSGGQRQRVAIARALLHRPELLLCDEPTGNLDRETGEQIIDIFAELHRELGTTLVVVTHEDRLSRLGGRALSMAEGKLFAP